MISIEEILSEVSHELGIDPGLVKDGVEAHLQVLLAEHCEVLGEGFRLVRREYPTDIGPVDLLCRDATGATVAVEIKRRGEIDGVEQLTRYLERLDRDPAPATRTRRVCGAGDQAAGAGARDRAGDRLRRGRLRRAARHRAGCPLAVLTYSVRAALRARRGGGVRASAGRCRCRIRTCSRRWGGGRWCSRGRGCGRGGARRAGRRC